MSTVEKSIRLYAWKTNYQTFQVVQGEANSRKFNIQLFSTTIPVDLTNCEVMFYAVKPDSTEVYVECEVIDAENGLASVTLIDQMCVVDGTVDCWVQVIGEGGTDLRFEGMNIEVSPCLMTMSLESSDDMRAFLQQSAKLAAIETEVKNARAGKNNLREKQDAQDKALTDTAAAIRQELEVERTRIDNIINRRCKFDFCNNLDQTLSKEYDQIYEYSTVADKIEIANYYKMRGVWIAVEIKPSREQCESYSNGEISGEDLELNVLPDADYVGDMVDDVIASGLEVVGIKFHNNWICANWATLKEYRESIFAKYETAINDVMSRIAGNTERVTVLNESKNMLTDSDNASYIKNMLANIKAKGYKVGFCGIDYFATDLFDCVDILSLHWYPYISNKNDKTTVEDCKLAWEIYLSEKRKAMYDFHFDYPTKEVWIVETGVQNYWEALRAPETYISDGTASENNVVQYMFFNALFEVINCEFIEGVCAWYFSNAKYELMASLMNEYFGKEIE